VVSGLWRWMHGSAGARSAPWWGGRLDGTSRSSGSGWASSAGSQHTSVMGPSLWASYVSLPPVLLSSVGIFGSVKAVTVIRFTCTCSLFGLTCQVVGWIIVQQLLEPVH